MAKDKSKSLLVKKVIGYQTEDNKIFTGENAKKKAEEHQRAIFLEEIKYQIINEILHKALLLPKTAKNYMDDTGNRDSLEDKKAGEIIYLFTDNEIFENDEPEDGIMLAESVYDLLRQDQMRFILKTSIEIVEKYIISET